MFKVLLSLAIAAVLVSFSIDPAIALPIHASSADPLLGQLPSFTAPSIQPLPLGVERRGTLESAGVRLDGRELFRIASPAVLDRNNLNGQIPVEVRARQVEANLDQLIPDRRSTEEGSLDPQTLIVVIETINGQPVLFVRDDTMAEARVLLTVTDADAQYHAISKERLARRWKDILERELRQALALRQPEAQRQQIFNVSRVIAAAAFLTALLGLGLQTLSQRQRRLSQRQTIETEAARLQAAAQSSPAIAPIDREASLFQELRQHFNLEQRLQILRFGQWLLFWAIVLLWGAALAYSLNAFPQTRHFARKVITVPIAILLIGFVTGLTNRLVDLAIDRFIRDREQAQTLTPANLQRIGTIARAIKGLKMVLVYAIAVLWLLQGFNIVPGSILTLGAVFTLIVSFAAQNLVRDLVNGFLILLEDQFRIGDNVRIGNTTGMVENLNLRITQIRTDEGNFITLPNSLIAEVENRSRSWARADFRVEVAYHTDIDRAMAIVRATAEQMACDPAWRSIILDTHELLGVEQISHSGMVIRIWIKTIPLQQWNTARELRRRLKIAFDRHQIQIGIPQHLIVRNGFGQVEQIDPIDPINPVKPVNSAGFKSD